MSNSQTNTSVLLNHVKTLREIARDYGAAELLPELVEQEKEFCTLLSDIQNGVDWAEPRPDEDAETVLCGLRERYAPNMQDMLRRASLLTSLTNILSKVEDIARFYARDIEGKEGAQ